MKEVRVHARWRKPPSVYGLVAIGPILAIEPALPHYRFSLFWFSLGVLGTAVGLHYPVQKSR